MNTQIIPCIGKNQAQIRRFKLLESGFYENDNISNDSIRQLVFQFLGQWYLVLNTVAFDNLKSTGMDILSNDRTKTMLLILYGNNYKYVKGLQAYYDKSHYDKISLSNTLNNINWYGKLTIKDKKNLIGDRQLFLQMKGEAKYSLPKYLRELEKIKPILQKLIENINQEIERLKKK